LKTVIVKIIEQWWRNHSKQYSKVRSKQIGGRSSQL